VLLSSGSFSSSRASKTPLGVGPVIPIFLNVTPERTLLVLSESKMPEYTLHLPSRHHGVQAPGGQVSDGAFGIRKVAGFVTNEVHQARRGWRAKDQVAVKKGQSVPGLSH